MNGRPPPRLVRSPQEAEELAAAWMRHMGFSDAVATQVSRDGGIDVAATSAVAQVKMHAVPIGRPALQQLQGAALGRRALFFSLMSYTDEARRWADSVGMSLFRFNHGGEIDPENQSARALLESIVTFDQAGGRAERPAFATLPDHNLVALVHHGVAKGRPREVVSWAVHAWLLMTGLQCRYTLMEYGPQVFTVPLWYDSIVGSYYRPNGQPQGTVIDAAMPHVAGGADLASIKEQVQKSHKALARLTRPDARARHAQELTSRGVSPFATSVQLSELTPALLPIVLAMYTRKGAERIVVLDAATGSADRNLAAAVQQTFRWAIPEVQRVGRRLI